MKYYMKKIINILIYFFSLPIPQTSQFIIVGGWFGQRFADNSKALYLYLFRNKTKLGLKKVIYITKNKTLLKELKEENLEVLYAYSLVSIWYHMRAKIHIVDEGGTDLNRFFSIKAKRINLWHGFPLKKIGYYCDSNLKNIHDAITENSSKKQYQIGLWHCSYYLAFSSTLARHLQYAFGCTDDKIINGPYPRQAYMNGTINKIFLSNEKIAIGLLKEIRDDNKKVVFYLPTFRDEKSNNNICLQTIFSLKPFLREKNLCLLTKLHFATDIENPLSNDTDGNVINLPKECDVYNFLDLSDLLITDYSSVYF